MVMINKDDDCSVLFVVVMFLMMMMIVLVCVARGCTAAVFDAAIDDGDYDNDVIGIAASNLFPKQVLIHAKHFLKRLID